MRKSIRCARKAWLEHFGYSTKNPMPYVRVAALIIRTYPRLQYDGVGVPESSREAGKFVEFCYNKAINKTYAPYRRSHVLLRDPLPTPLLTSSV